MNRPLDAKEDRKLAGAIHSMAHEPAFSVFVEWLKSELAKRDIENRSREFANKTTEAEALGFIVEYIDACQSSGADLNPNAEPDEERTSAALII